MRKRLPLNLLDALRAFDRLDVLREGARRRVVACLCAKLKQMEWNAYARHLTDWETETDSRLLIALFRTAHMKYSALSLAWNALPAIRLESAWRDAAPRPL